MNKNLCSTEITISSSIFVQMNAAMCVFRQFVRLFSTTAIRTMGSRCVTFANNSDFFIFVLFSFFALIKRKFIIFFKILAFLVSLCAAHELLAVAGAVYFEINSGDEVNDEDGGEDEKSMAEIDRRAMRYENLLRVDIVVSLRMSENISRSTICGSSANLAKKICHS